MTLPNPVSQSSGPVLAPSTGSAGSGDTACFQKPKGPIMSNIDPALVIIGHLPRRSERSRRLALMAMRLRIVQARATDLPR